MSAVPHLQKQLKDITQHPVAGFRIESSDDIFQWIVWFSGPKDTLYYPGQYKAQMKFPSEFPFKPPEFRILSSFWHPNVYDDGRVCISILHEPGEDAMNSLETAQMRWTPVQSIEKVLLSIISLLADPDPAEAGAPANVNALVEFRKNRPAYAKRCAHNAEKSLRELPEGFVPPPDKDEKPELNRQVSAFSDHVFDTEDLLDDGHPGGGATAGSSTTTADGHNKSSKHAVGGGGASGQAQHPYAAELSQVRNMGVGCEKTDEQLLELLSKYKGDVSRVIDALC